MPIFSERLKANPIPGKWSVYDAAGKLAGSGFLSRSIAEQMIPPSERDAYKFLLEPATAASKPILHAKFGLGDKGAIEEALRLYAKSLSAQVSDVNVTAEIGRSANGGEDCILVIGRPQVVMSIIGLVADQGHDGLVSVS